MLRSLRAWDIRQVEFCSSLDDQPPANPLDRPGGARRRALPLVAFGVAAGRRRRALRASRRRCRADHLPKKDAGRVDLVVEDVRQRISPPHAEQFFGPPRPSNSRPSSKRLPTPAQGGVESGEWRVESKVKPSCHLTIRTSIIPIHHSSPCPLPDLDIGVIYTHERELMPRLLGDDVGLGRGAANAADPGRQRLGRTASSRGADTSPRRWFCATTAASATPPT